MEKVIGHADDRARSLACQLRPEALQLAAGRKGRPGTMLVMGTWGPAIFSDDEACDVRDVYKALLGDEVPDEQAEGEALATLADDDGIIRPAVWLGLAATQSRLGRLSPSVKDRALSIIDDGSDLAEWQDAPVAERRKRDAALDKLRGQLTGPQPPRRRVRRQWMYRTSLGAGDVLAASVPSGVVRVLRVVDVRRDQRFGDWALVELLRYHGSEPPRLEAVERLPATFTTWRGAPREHRWLVANNHVFEPDWSALDFVLLGRIAQRPGDDQAFVHMDAEADARVDALSSAPADDESTDASDASDEPPFTVWERLPALLAGVLLDPDRAPTTDR